MSAELSVLPTGQRSIEVRNAAPRSEARPVPGARAQQPAAEREASAAEARKAIAAANDQLKQIDSELTFQLDNDTGRVVVKLIDRNTREVLRQMPTKEALAIARALAAGGGSGSIVNADA
jgi:flagellar protein FlaG